MLDKVITGEKTFLSLKPCDLSTTDRRKIKEYFENSYNLNESLFTALKDDTVMYLCPDRLRLPLIFYYGHTACVYMNKLILAGLIKSTDRINLEYETIFETGVDEMSWDDTENYRMGGKYQWPKLDDVVEYRRKVRSMIIDVIEKTPLQLPITMHSPWWGVIMGIEHERVHIETSSVLIRQLPVNLLDKPKGFVYGPLCGSKAVTENPLITLRGGKVRLGKPEAHPSYGWDNEYGKLDCNVPGFSASKFMITNREFLEFMEAGGYEKKALWTPEGWQWKTYCEAVHPYFWVCDKGCKGRCGAKLAEYTHCPPTSVFENHITNGNNGYCNGHDTVDDNGHQGKDEGGGQHYGNGTHEGCNGQDLVDIDSYGYKLRCIFDVLPMPWDWPAEVNYHEAKAYCAWMGSGYHLPTEAEYAIMRGDTDFLPKSNDCDSFGPNMHLLYGSSTPVNMFEANEMGFHDVMGNVWEWSEDHFNGLPGFKTVDLYDDFSTPCFDGLHNILLGGSWATTGSMTSHFARVSFRRHFMQHCGFRLAKPLANGPENSPLRVVGTPVYIQGYGYIDNDIMAPIRDMIVEPVASSFRHYVIDTDETLRHQIALEYDDDGPILNTFRQIENWKDAHGVAAGQYLHLGCGAANLSFRLATLCQELLAVDTSGHLVDFCLGLQTGKGQKEISCGNVPVMNGGANITFKQFHWLPNEVGCFDLVVVTLFDRVHDITGWLLRMCEIVNPGGLLVLAQKDSTMDQPRVPPHFQKEFKLVDSGSGFGTSTLSVWKHK